MPLDTYNARRDFDRTPEPAGGAEPATDRPRFVIQQHDATRMHYDFRLELDGVLKSWAVPKGPSLDPSVKRLAVETEDHPLDYATFEGVIPEGEYGGGPVVVWDHGSWTPDGDPRAGLEKGHLEFHLDGEKLHGGWRLVRTRGTGGKQPSWILMKRNDAHAERGRVVPIVDALPRSVLTGRTLEEIAAGLDEPRRRAIHVEGSRPGPLPDRLQPQLACLVEAPPTGPGWVEEVKLDGYRLLARRQGSDVTLLTRQGNDWTARFPSIARAVLRLPVEAALLDGEVVILDRAGRSSFAALQQAMSTPDAPFVYFAFDLLHLDGADLRPAPLWARKEALREVLDGVTGPIRFGDHVQAVPADFLREACALGLEGMVCKRLDAPYESGRTKTWLKLKCLARQELVVVGWTDPAGSRPCFGALLLGVRDEDGLRYAGKVGTGFDAATLRSLHARLEDLATDAPPVRDPPRARGLHWVEPRLVAEVAFAEWTDDGLVRQPSFQGIREDKPADEVVRERAPARRRAPRVEGVAISSPDKLMFPDFGRAPPSPDPSRRGSAPDPGWTPAAGITKLELAETVAALAPRMLPLLLDRPLTLYRCPEGLSGACFFQKHDKVSVPESLRRVRFPDDPEDYLAVEDVQGLVGLVQIGVLEVHVHGMHADALDRPDLLVMDLDPAPDVSFGRVAATAFALRERLDALGLVPFLRVTGGKGLHVVAPIERGPTWDEVRAFTHGLAALFARREPEAYTDRLSKDRRAGRILIDWVRNTQKSTAIATWSTRARPGAPVAAPLAWSELDPGAPAPPVIGLRDAVARPDPWEGFAAAARPLPRA